MVETKKKVNSEYIIICGLFIISIIFRFTISNFPKIISIYPDELRYTGIAKNLIHGNGLKIGLLETDYQKILYSLFIAPAYLFKGATTQNVIITLLNSIYMSAAVFPIYFLCKEVKLTKTSIWGVELLFLVFSDMIYTMTYMSEVIYMPLLMLAIYMTYKIINIPYSKKRVYMSIMTGVVYYFLYLCKEIALGLLIAFVLTEMMYMLKNRSNWKRESIVVFAVAIPFIILFLLAKFTFFYGMGNSYNQMGITAILSSYNLYYLFYSALYYALCFLIAAGVFPVILPALGYKAYDKEVRKFTLFIFLMAIVSVGVVAYTISVREDLGKIAPRQHLRYIYPIVFPFLIVMLKGCDSNKDNSKKKSLKDLVYIFIIFAILLFFFFAGIGAGPCVDQTPLKYISVFMNKFHYTLNNAGEGFTIDMVKIFICVGILIFLFIGITTYLIPNNTFKYYILTVIIAVNTINYVICVDEFKQMYEISDKTKNEMEQINELVYGLDGNVLCVVGFNAETWGLIDTYITSKDISIVYADTLNTTISSNAYIDLNVSELVGKFPYQPYKDLYSVDYLLVEKGSASFKEGTVENITPEGVEKFEVYKNVFSDKIYYRAYMPVEVGETTTIKAENGFFYSRYAIQGVEYVSGEEADFLIYGPYFPLHAGKYSVTIYYSCNEHADADDIIGYADVNLSGDEYVSEIMQAGMDKVQMNFTLENDCPNIEFRIWAAEPGIQFHEIEVTKLE